MPVKSMLRPCTAAVAAPMTGIDVVEDAKEAVNKNERK